MTQALALSRAAMITQQMKRKKQNTGKACRNKAWGTNSDGKMRGSLRGYDQWLKISRNELNLIKFTHLTSF